MYTCIFVGILVGLYERMHGRPEREFWKGEGQLFKLLALGLTTRGIGGVVGLMLPLALAAEVRVSYTTSPCSDLGQVVNLSLSVA